MSSAVQFVLVAGLLLVPTTLMGATLPIVSQAVADDERPGRRVGTLYAVNTFGAVLGVALAGYVLLPALGNRLTTGLAVAGNLAVGVLALRLARRGGAAEIARTAPPVADLGRAPTPLTTWITITALGVSGAVSMAYEVAWTRALSLVIGSSTYSFTAMLLAFLVGIAGGSAIYAWLRASGRATAAQLGALQLGIALASLATLLGFELLPLVFLETIRWSRSPGFVLLAQFALSSCALLGATLLVGATFPCAIAVAARARGRLGRDVGHLYAVNTLGALAGAILTGFVLVPSYGVHASLKLAIAANLVLAAALFALSWGVRPAWRGFGVGATAAAVAVVVTIAPWDPRVMTSGPAVYATPFLDLPRAHMGEAMREAYRLLYYRDGPSGTISVHAGPGTQLLLRVNGKTDASTPGDMPTQLMLGHLPLLVHPAPRAALVIGIGSGITTGAIATHGEIERLDVVEIEPAVVEAARFFAHLHRDVLRDPRVRTIVADGRSLLLTTDRRYDVIVSEPSNPWIGGLASLFSVEFFRLARERLRPDGVMVQWLQSYNLHPEDVRMVVNTFRTVFPATTVWSPLYGGDLLLVGTTGPGAVDLARIQRLHRENPGFAHDLAALGMPDWPGVLSYLVLGARDTERFAAGAGLNTDDRLPLEFSAPRALYVNTSGDNLRRLLSYRTSTLPDVADASRHALERVEVQHALALAHLRRGAWSSAVAHSEWALRLDPRHVASAVVGGQAALRLGRPDRALVLARAVLEREPANADAERVANAARQVLDRVPVRRP
jgi:spermidine synthase